MSVLLAIGPAALLYGLGLARAGGRGRAMPTLAWAAGLLVLAVAVCGPVDRAADRQLSVHMVQHGLLGLVVAPLLAAGAPVRLAFAAARRRATRRRLAALLSSPAVKALTHPAAGALAFVGTLAVVHVPAVYDLSLRSGLAHAGVHAALLWSALLLWIPLIGADPLPRRPSPAATVGAPLLAMGAMAVLGAALAAEQHVVYAPYATRTRDALADQQTAGGVMAVGGMAVMVPLLLGLAWRALAAEERRATVREARGLPAEGAR